MKENKENEILIKIEKKTKKPICCMSIPNVYPGPLRSVKQPGKAKTAQFHQKWRKTRKINFMKISFL